MSGMDVVDKIKKGDDPNSGMVKGPDKIVSMKLFGQVSTIIDNDWYKEHLVSAEPDTNTLHPVETTKGRVIIKLRPDLAPGHVARIKQWSRKASTTASPSTA